MGSDGIAPGRVQMMKRNILNTVGIGACVALLMTMSACSSSKVSSGDQANGAGDDTASLDSGTDAVPMGDLEQIEGNLDNSQAKPDAKTAQEGDGLAPTDKSADQSAATPPADNSQADAQPTDSSPAPASDGTATATDNSATPPSTDNAAADATPPADQSADNSDAGSAGDNSADASSDAATPPAQATASSDDGSGGTQNYTVQAGDTLMKIAFETYGDLYQWHKIYDENKGTIQDPNVIPPGTVLKIDQPSSPVSIDRNGDKYEIKSGDTLGTISDNIYGTPKKWHKLWDNNKQLIKDPNKIFAGFFLYYTMTPEERHEAEKLKQMKETNPQPLAQDQTVPSDAGSATTADNAAAGDQAPAAAPVQPAQQAQDVRTPAGTAPAAGSVPPPADPGVAQPAPAAPANGS